MEHIKKIIKKICPLNRYNVSPGLDRALEEIKLAYPEMVIHKYPTGKKIFDWIVPKKWDLKSASLTHNGKQIFSHNDNPLRVWSGSWPTNKNLSYNELLEHVKYDKNAPKLLPWDYKYYWHNENYFGFSLTENEFNSLSKEGEYNIQIESRFYDDYLHMGTITLPGNTENYIIISSDVCHPGQANDSLSGVACSLNLLDQLKKIKNRFYSYLFTFQPEMIGTIAFLAHNEKLIKKIHYGMLAEMIGTPGRPVLQKSFQENTSIDTTSFNVMMKKYNGNIEVKSFLNDCVVNDELILCHSGIDIPTVAFNRGSFFEYHTSGDNYDILDFDLIKDFSDTQLEIIKEMEKNCYLATPFERVPPRKTPANRYQELINYNPKDYIPIPKFKGPIFLSKYGLYVDINENPSLNTIIDKIMIRINGVNSCADIAKQVGTNFLIVDEQLKKYYNKSLIDIKKL